MAHIKEEITGEKKDEVYIEDYKLIKIEVEILIDEIEYENQNSNPKKCNSKNTIYIGAPYYIHIISKDSGSFNIYKSNQNKNNTKEFYFDDINLHKLNCKFTMNFVNIYKIIRN